MTDFDPYSQKIADVCALIRQHGKCEAWELFKNSENGLEVLCSIVDAVRAEAKAAVPEGWKLVPKTSTSAMDRAGEDAYEGSGYCDCGNANGCSMEAVFDAMLAAAPVPPIAVAEQTKQQEPK